MKRVIFAILFVVGLAAGAGWWYLRPRQITYLTDADTIRESAATASLREILWQKPAPLVDLIQTTADEFEPRVSSDGGTLFFVRGKPGRNTEIFACTRERSGWTNPRALAEINTEYDELGPEPAADGKSLFFYSDRPGGIGGYDLWVSRKNDDGWQTPENLGVAVNSVYNEYGPAISPDGDLLCFSTNRPKPGEAIPSDDAWQATVREDLYRHDYDLYSARLTENGFQPAAAIESLNSPGNDGAAAFSPIGDFLYFASDRPSGFGGFDLYRARIVRGVLQAPANLGGGVNTSANELDPALDVGGYALHFSSDRVLQNAAESASSVPRYHLFRSFSREVFHDVEVKRPVVDWAALWRQVGPNVMWALLALIIFILLLALMRDLHRRRLSLLARCLIVSLMIHALLMLWFNAVKVSASIATAMRRQAPIRVSLGAAGRGGGDLSIQIRGGLTDAAAPPATVSPLDRAAPTITPAISAKPVELAVEQVAIAPRELSAIRVRADDAVTPALGAPVRMTPTPQFADSTGGDFALPSEQSRSSTAENAERAPSAGEAMKIGRYLAAIPTSQPGSGVARVELGIEGGGGTIPGASECLAASGPIADAPVPGGASPGLMQRALTAVVIGAAGNLDPAIPSMEGDARQSGGESGSESAKGQAVRVGALPRAGANFGGSMETTTIVNLPVEPSVAAGVGEGSLVEGSGLGSGSGEGFGDGVSSAEIPIGGPPGISSNGISLADGSTAPAFQLPNETTPPPAPTPPVQAMGRIHGRVIDDVSGERLSGARIELDLPGGAAVIVNTDSKGRYELAVPDLPDHFAVSASKPGFLPETQNVARRLVAGRSMRLNFSLRPQSLQVVALEDSPTVHHLGNDAYEGQINSQFQREAEGRTYTGEFSLSRSQIAPGLAEVEMLAKGVQCPHKIRINGELLDMRLDFSPDDGSFGSFTATFDSSLLQEGTNTIEIRGISCNGDLDDFEFVNLQIRLMPEAH